jgi:lactate 2-monooxygenase
MPDEKVKAKITPESLEFMIKLAKKFPGSSIENIKTKRAIKAVKAFSKIFANPALNWDDLDWLRNLTDLPIILKGIVHPEDAQKAKDIGMDGIIVSNHGGRQLAGSISSLDALSWISKEVKDFPLMIDSGIRTGEDIFKALALGASAVCVGRPYVYGLAIDGAFGVEEVMRNLMGSFDMAMALTCSKDINEVKNTVLYKV